MARLLCLTLVLMFCTSFKQSGSPTLEWLQWQKSIQQMKNQLAQRKQELANLENRIDQLYQRTKTVPNVVQGRLTWVSNTPVPTTTSAAATIIYFTPYKGSLLSLYYRGGWKLFRFTQISYTLSGLNANTNYDVFIYRNATTQTFVLELSAAWASATTRTDAIALQDGIYVKQGDPTRRYLGTFRTNATATQYSFSANFRNLWNYYNRVPIFGRVFDATNSWNYNNNAYRQAGADAANDVNYVVGINETLVRVRVKTNIISAAAAARAFSVGIGLDSTTTNSALLLGGRGNGTGTTSIQMWAEYAGYPGIGYHTISWIESCPAGANVTSWGDNGSASATRSGTVLYLEG